MLADLRTGKIVATAFCEGKCADFALFKRSKTPLTRMGLCLADSGYQGLDKLHANARTPKKKSKHHRLTDAEKASNKALSRQRIGCEHVMARLKVFKILAERYRNRRRRFGLRFNLIAALCNLARNE